VASDYFLMRQRTFNRQVIPQPPLEEVEQEFVKVENVMEAIKKRIRPPSIQTNIIWTIPATIQPVMIVSD